MGASSSNPAIDQNDVQLDSKALKTSRKSKKNKDDSFVSDHWIDGAFVFHAYLTQEGFLFDQVFEIGTVEKLRFQIGLSYCFETKRLSGPIRALDLMKDFNLSMDLRRLDASEIATKSASALLRAVLLCILDDQ